MNPEKTTLDNITSKIMISQLFKSINVMNLVNLKSNSYIYKKVCSEYTKELTNLTFRLAELHFGNIDKKEIDEIPSAKYVDPLMHMNDCLYYFEKGYNVFKNNQEKSILSQILILMNETKNKLNLDY